MNIGELLAERDGKTVWVISPHQTVRDAASKMFSHAVGSLVVIDGEEKPVGLITQRDLMRAIKEYGGDLADTPVSVVMTRLLRTCTPDDHVDEVLSRMKLNKIGHMPVMKGDKLSSMVGIRDLARAVELLQVQADTDALTGLSNRRYFVETLGREINRCQRYGRTLSVAMIDADKFKKINDTHGHDAGDRCLQALAKLFIEEFRNCDRIGRLGGEEFAVVFPETEIQDAKLACVRLLEKIRSAEIKVDTAKIYCTVSIGLTQFGTYTSSSSAILKRADRLMYEAKVAGGNRIEMELFGAESENVSPAPAAVNL